MKVIFYTLFALLAFAGNSVLCRLALGENEIDASSFTAIRLFSGAIVLALLLRFTQRKVTMTEAGSWKAALMLFIYAATFSFAYISLETGVGALILFGSVQITLIVANFMAGKKLQYLELLGVIIAFLGIVYLVQPSLSTPSLLGFVLMSLSGIAWAAYTLLGRSSNNPLADTAFNFFRTLPFALLLIVMTFQHATLSEKGIVLAVLSGGIASAVGYTIWYAALRHISISQAGVLQLLVPIIAAAGGVLFVNEMLSLRLVLSSLMVLGGIMIVILGNNDARQSAVK